jgi:hypothetical protein
MHGKGEAKRINESVWALDEGDTVEGRRENMFGILTEAEEVKHGVRLVCRK